MYFLSEDERVCVASCGKEDFFFVTDVLKGLWHFFDRKL